MSSAAEASGKRRCKGTSKRGEPCRASVVGASGYCPVHDPAKPIDMRELGRRGGKGRRRGVAEQLPAAERESLRERLRDKLNHDVVQTAIERALAGGNESARVAAVKFLADLELYRKDGDECPRCAAWSKGEVKASADKFMQALAGQIENVVRDVVTGGSQGAQDAPVTRMIREAVTLGLEVQGDELQALVARAMTAVRDSLASSSGIVVEHDVSAAEAEAILAELTRVGLIVPADEAAELSRLSGKVDRLEAQLAAIPQAVREEFAVA